MSTVEDVLQALNNVKDPEQHRSIVELGRVQKLEVRDGKVSFSYVLPSLNNPFKGLMQAEAKRAVEGLPGVTSVEVRMEEGGRAQGAPRGNQAVPGIKRIIAVGSGKGGVGKSTVAANLAAALAAEGLHVGLLDADVYGPNQPQMFGIEGYQPRPDENNKIVPPENHGVKVMSMGFLVAPDQAIVWRGPMLHGAVNQFLSDVIWGELDYLVVDLPPGTGDVQISLCQSTPILGSVIVTTPQSIAISDVRKAVSMFKKLNVPILGIVENMAEFHCPKCEHATSIFSRGGADALGERAGAPVLARLPLDPATCEAGEKGVPAVLAQPASATAKAFKTLAKSVVECADAAAEAAPNLAIETA